MAKQKRNRLGAGDTNVFSKGCLVSLRVRCWGASARLTDESLYGTDLLVDEKEMVRAVYDLLEKKDTELKHLHGMRDEAKRYLYQRSIPFPVDGLVFIFKKDIVEVNEGLKRRQEDFLIKVDRLLDVYDERVRSYKTKCPHLYRAEKYPSKTSLRSRFTFEWSFRHFTVPDVELSILPPEVYKEELERVKKEGQNMIDSLVTTVARAFIKKVDTLKEQCVGDSVSTATVNSLKEYLDRFDSLWDGFIGHKELKKMVAQTKDYLDGIGADELRVDSDFRQMVGQKMDEISTHFASVADARLHRRLDL